ncbi:MAG TPA: restriction endonuclease subunit S [Verrucomicrobiota bacterium]|nr:restriction endonuclease subunit S [Verrucomicrobiota bacterium]
MTDDGHLDMSDIRHIAEEDFAKWTRRVEPKPGDIVFTYEATLNRYAIIPEGFRGCLGRRMALIRTDPKKVDAGFLFYYFFSPAWREVIKKNMMTGATVDRIPLITFPNFPVNVPPLPVQRRIAGILSAYDELMENSQRRIRLLEAMARALYREWFVHFRFPGHERIRLVGSLPEGWTRKPLEEVAQFRLGKMLDQEKNRGDLLSYLANVNVRWGEFDLQELRQMRFEQDELETYGLKFGDIVMCEGGEPGRCAIWKEQILGMMIQKAIHRIRCRENMDHIYLYHSLRDQGESGHLAALFTGATIKHLPREKLAKVTVVVPSAPLLRKFGEATHSMEAQAETLQRQIQNLRRTRDLLLPRLLSGQVELETEAA